MAPESQAPIAKNVLVAATPTKKARAGRRVSSSSHLHHLQSIPDTPEKESPTSTSIFTQGPPQIPPRVIFRCSLILFRLSRISKNPTSHTPGAARMETTYA